MKPGISTPPPLPRSNRPVGDAAKGCRSIPAPPPGRAASQALKDEIREMALGILEEQVQARIIIYRADLETNPELDAITAEVVAQLKEIQAQTRALTPPKETIRDSQIRLLGDLLARVFPKSGQSLLVEKCLKEIHKRLARLFFESELHDKTRGKDGHSKVIQHGEQALYYLLKRYENRLATELGGFDFASDEVRERSFEVLAKLAKDMETTFLRTTIQRASANRPRLPRRLGGFLRADPCAKHCSLGA